MDPNVVSMSSDRNIRHSNDALFLDKKDIKNINPGVLDFFDKSPEDMLQNFIPDYLCDARYIEAIDRKTNKQKRIGEKSSFGEVYPVKNNDNIIVKITNICSQRCNFTRNQCAHTRQNDDILYRVPHDCKELLSIPNYFSEGLIGIILSNDIMKKYTPSLSKTYAHQYDRSNTLSYTVMEKLHETWFMPSIKDIGYFLFQIFHTLDVLQELYMFTHYDLHLNNIMTRKNTKSYLSIYPVGDGNYIYFKDDKDYVIIDYGFSRIETEDIILKPSVMFMINGLEDHRNRNRFESVDRYEFNPYYDAYCLLYNFYTELLKSSDLSPVFGKFVGHVCSEFFGGGFYDNGAILAEFDKRSIVKDYFRPIPELLSRRSESGEINPVLTPKALKHIVAKFITDNLQNGQNVLRMNDFKYYMKRYGVCVTGGIMNTSIIKEDEIRFFNSVEARFKLETFYPMNMIKENGNEPEIYDINTIIKDDVFYHVCLFDQEKAINRGYKASFICCNIDIRNYMRKATIKSGIAINGSFFRIRDNYMPIGYSKTGKLLSEDEIVKEYKDDYQCIVIRHDGRLDIASTGQKYSQHDQIITPGPQILKDGKMVEKYTNNVQDKYYCRNPGENDNREDSMFKDGKYNCERITPSELKNLKPENPRAAFFTRKDGIIGFVYVEGRGAEGKGVSAKDLANICLSNDAINAISVDSGMSSQMVWRKRGEDVIYSTNDKHEYSYPVGNIISFVLE